MRNILQEHVKDLEDFAVFAASAEPGKVSPSRSDPNRQDWNVPNVLMSPQDFFFLIKQKARDKRKGICLPPEAFWPVF